MRCLQAKSSRRTRKILERRRKKIHDEIKMNKLFVYLQLFVGDEKESKHKSEWVPEMNRQSFFPGLTVSYVNKYINFSAEAVRVRDKLLKAFPRHRTRSHATQMQSFLLISSFSFCISYCFFLWFSSIAANILPWRYFAAAQVVVPVNFRHLLCIESFALRVSEN